MQFLLSIGIAQRAIVNLGNGTYFIHRWDLNANQREALIDANINGQLVVSNDDVGYWVTP
jgi:hypothetical protein